VQQPSIPLWFGARAPASLTRAVDMADGWMGAGSTSIPDFLEQIAFVRNLLAERGRDEASFGLSKRLYMAVDTDADRARERMRDWVGAFYGNPALADRWAVTGTPDQILRVIEPLREAGARHLLLNPVFDYDAQLDLIASEIVPAL
jgi:alkanesulfonate monooxygenase SsuD/methylene tetrahydromethanopterin reductase-like flavin-dependent oxidoreductase (luciferase family)